MDPLNQAPELAPLPPRLRLFQSVLAIALFSLVPLWPANAQAAAASASSPASITVSSPGR